MFADPPSSTKTIYNIKKIPLVVVSALREEGRGGETVAQRKRDGERGKRARTYSL